MPTQVAITIIGGGVVGCAVAYELSQHSDQDIFLIERNAKIRGENQSSRNSGVIHAGIYYPKSRMPLKARFCVEGNRLLYEFCKEHNVSHKNTGKLLVATNPIEEESLVDVLKTAQDNGVPGIKLINGRKAKEYEPNVIATSALYVPTSGIIEATEYVNTLYKLAQGNGVHFVTGNEVINIDSRQAKFQVTTKSLNNATESFETEILINAAGLYSDDISRMVNSDSPYQMDPLRGEAAKFYKTRRANIAMNGLSVYPAPYGFYNATGEKAEVSFRELEKLVQSGKVTKTIGIHLTPTFDIVGDKYAIGKTVTIGPTSTIGIKKDDYSSNLYPPKYYLESIRRFFPNLKLEDIELHQAGIRAKLKGYSDFIIERNKKQPNFINLVGIDSPGLTSSLAIARYVRELIKK
jgi:L-2-hydroxyglutarate oxidase LhgO